MDLDDLAVEVKGENGAYYKVGSVSSLNTLNNNSISII